MIQGKKELRRRDKTIIVTELRTSPSSLINIGLRPGPSPGSHLDIPTIHWIYLSDFLSTPAP